jgi:hypothetical protein
MKIVRQNGQTEHSRQKAMTETYAIATRLDEIQRLWPGGREMPSLIACVANYLRDKTWGSAGEIRWTGDRMNDWWIENGADLAGEFGVFMRLPEGSLIAVWYHDGATPGAEPIVYIGSEGSSYVCGATLAGFFESIASLRDGERLPAEFRKESASVFEDDEEALADERPGLLEFLRGLPGWHPTPTAAAAGAPDVTKRLNNWQEAQIAANAVNPTMQAIVRSLDSRIPRGKQPWESVSFGISVCGDRLSVYTLNGRDRQPLQELADLTPLVQQLRAERAHTGPPQRGVWHRAHLDLYPDGHASIKADWSEAPEFPDGSQPTRDELGLDLNRFPRGPRWIEPWMEPLK